MTNYLNTLIWRVIAAIVSTERVGDWLIKRAMRTPYTHIMSVDGSEIYMGRWWLFNPYPASGEAKRFGWGWLPSVRIHHIMREDDDRHLHDHPWNARTILLEGWYTEQRQHLVLKYNRTRTKGYTGRLLFGEYHRITAVPEVGVWTLFITWKQRGTWGFDVDGVKVPWREYLATEKNNGLQKP
jgi:hypothetical protein